MTDDKPMSAPEKVFNAVLDRYPAVEKVSENLHRKSPEEFAELVQPWVRIAITLLIVRMGPKHLVKLSAALNEVGAPVPVLTKKQARAIWRPASSLVALLAFRAVASGRATLPTATKPAKKKAPKSSAEEIAGLLVNRQDVRR